MTTRSHECREQASATCTDQGLDRPSLAKATFWQWVWGTRTIDIPGLSIKRKLRWHRLGPLIRLTMLGAGSYAPVYAFQGLWKMALGQAAGFCLALLSEWMRVRRPLSHWSATLYMLSVMTALLCVPLFGTLGESYALWMFAVIPLVAGVIQGKRGIVRWGVVAWFLLLFFSFVAPHLGIEREYYAKPHERDALVFTCFGVYTLFAWVASNARAQQSEEHFKANVELIRQRSILDAAGQAKASFLASMSHEIRTPMNGILGMLECLRLQSIDEGDLELVDLAQRSGMRMLETLNGILDYSKIQAGKLELGHSQFAAQSLFSGLIHHFEPLAHEKGLKLVANLPETDAMLLGDRHRAHQLLAVFLDNAIRHTDHGSIRFNVLETEKAEPCGVRRREYRFRIGDDGDGLSLDRTQPLFLDETSLKDDHEMQGGVGFGFMLASRLAELMGGSVHIVSSDGAGTEFEVILGFEEVDCARASGLDAKQAWTGRVHARVLVVDDTPVNRKVAQMQLERFGCSVRLAEEGQEALEATSQEQFDLILMDLTMPNLSGAEVTAHLRQGSSTNLRTPIIAFTGHGSGPVLEEAMRAGMNGHLLKPVKSQDLIEVLRTYGTCVPNEEVPGPRAAGD